MRSKEKRNNMKKLYLAGVIAIALLVLTACEETTTTTTVHRDGSCRRVITIKSDKANLSQDAFPIALDNTWSFNRNQVETTKKVSTTDPKSATGTAPAEKGKTTNRRKAKHSESGIELKYIYTATKNFKKVEDMNREFFDHPKALPNIRRETACEKDFRWFYTFLTYREVCHKLNPFDRIPLENAFTAEEAEILQLSLFDEDKAEQQYSKEQLDLVEKKLTQWLLENVFAEVYHALEQAAKSTKVESFTPAYLETKKAGLMKRFEEEIKIFENLDTAHVYSLCGQVMPGIDMEELRQASGDAFRELEEKLTQWGKIDIFSGFKNKVIMPGIIIDTNAETVEGATVTWEAGVGKYFLADWEMWVTSRVVNWGAIGVTGFTILILIIGLVTGTLYTIRRNRRNAQVSF